MGQEFLKDTATKLAGSITHEMVFSNPALPEVGMLMGPLQAISRILSTVRQGMFSGSVEVNSHCPGLVISERIKPSLQT